MTVLCFNACKPRFHAISYTRDCNRATDYDTMTYGLNWDPSTTAVKKCPCSKSATSSQYFEI